MVEPWITLPSWILYRFFHHEECRLEWTWRVPSRSRARSPSPSSAWRGQVSGRWLP